MRASIIWKFAIITLFIGLTETGIGWLAYMSSYPHTKTEIFKEVKEIHIFFAKTIAAEILVGLIFWYLISNYLAARRKEIKEK